jgi:hypothetical protein
MLPLCGATSRCPAVCPLRSRTPPSHLAPIVRPPPARLQVPCNGLNIAIEFDGPNHFTAAPPSPSNAGGLFGAEPRRHKGEAALRELLVRANPGWVLAAVPFFDW